MKYALSIYDKPGSHEALAEEDRESVYRADRAGPPRAVEPDARLPIGFSAFDLAEEAAQEGAG